MTAQTNKTRKDEPVRIQDLPAELSERGRDIWLAGLGALSRVEEEGENIFRTLVERGEKFEARGRDQIAHALEGLKEQQKQATQTFSEAAGSVERAVSNTVTDTLGRMGVPRREEVKELSSKVSQLSEKLDALSATLDAQKTAATATVYHVVPHEEGWAVKRESAERATSVHDTKKEAVSSGRNDARAHVPSQLIVHKQDGTVQETFSYEDEG